MFWEVHFELYLPSSEYEVVMLLSKNPHPRYWGMNFIMAQVTLAVNFVAFGPVMTVAVLFIKFVVFAVVIASLGVCVVAMVNTGGCSSYVWAAVWLVFVTVLALVVGLLLWLLAFTVLLVV